MRAVSAEDGEEDGDGGLERGDGVAVEVEAVLERVQVVDHEARRTAAGGQSAAGRVSSLSLSLRVAAGGESREDFFNSFLTFLFFIFLETAHDSSSTREKELVLVVAREPLILSLSLSLSRALRGTAISRPSPKEPPKARFDSRVREREGFGW